MGYATKNHIGIQQAFSQIDRVIGEMLVLGLDRHGTAQPPQKPGTKGCIHYEYYYWLDIGCFERSFPKIIKELKKFYNDSQLADALTRRSGIGNIGITLREENIAAWEKAAEPQDRTKAFSDFLERANVDFLPVFLLKGVNNIISDKKAELAAQNMTGSTDKKHGGGWRHSTIARGPGG